MIRKLKASLKKILPETGVSTEQPEVKQEAVTEEKQEKPKEKVDTTTTGTIERLKLPEQISSPTLIKKDVLAKKRQVRDIYPLNTIKINKNNIVLAYAFIQFDPKKNHLFYQVIEPQLTKQLSEVVVKTIEELHDRLEVDISKIKTEQEFYSTMEKEINNIWKILGIKLTPQAAINVKYYIFRELIGLNKIDPLMRDPNIEDISCDGVGLPLYVFHRNPLYGEIQTNVVFNTKEKLDSFVMKLAQKCNKTVSVASPLMDGALKDGSRVQITYGTDIARRGSNFTIRKFFKVPLTPVDLLNFKTLNSITLAYLWLAIEKERSVLIAGTTATGKTTMLNSLSLFIEPNLKIVSIEDTAELQLPHINWMPQITRTGMGTTGYGEVSMYDLLKAALRQRPDYLIVGEVRGKEANVLFHAMSTGHPGLSTLHADTVEAVIDRLTTRPIDLPLSLLENLDIIVFLEKTRRDEKFMRRVGKIIEVEGYDSKEKQLKTNVAFEWDPVKDIINSKESSILHRLAKVSGENETEIHNELMRRVKVLEWMKNNQVFRFNDVAKVINMYYINPAELARLMGERG